MNCETGYQQIEREEVQDHCGILGAVSTAKKKFFLRGLSGLRILQTRGYDGAGFIALDEEGNVFQFKGEGAIDQVFSAAIIQEGEEVTASSWVFQTRYGTRGEFNKDNVQPFLGKHESTGEIFTLVHNGQFSEEKDHEDNGTESDTFIFSKQLEKRSGRNWDERIVSSLSEKKGAWSLIIGTKDRMYLARDNHGVRPLCYGMLNDGTWIAASETSALEAMGVRNYQEVLPGSILKFANGRIEELQQSTEGIRAVCIFENVYFQDGNTRAHLPRKTPEEIESSLTTDEVRYQCGKILGEEAPLTREEADLVIGVPGTGIPGGKGFAELCNLPYVQAITDKSPDNHRTFLIANIDKILQKVMEHFDFDPEALKGKRVVLVDDSIVRGNISKGLIRLLKEHFGVTEVHLRSLSPPIVNRCYLGINTRTNGELIAARNNGNIQEICEEIGANSLAYLSDQGLKRATTGNSAAEGFCLGCMLGHHPPIDQYGKET